jgi:hypothetical protein
MLLLSNEFSKAYAGVTDIPNTVNVPQENIAENPKFCTEISFVPRSYQRPTYHP